MMNISERAATEMKRYIDEQGDPNAAIRVFVQGACGCGSAQYGMGLEDEFSAEESIFELQGVRLVVWINPDQRNSESANHERRRSNLHEFPVESRKRARAVLHDVPGPFATIGRQESRGESRAEAGEANARGPHAGDRAGDFRATLREGGRSFF